MGTTPRVLLIDDEPAIRRELARALTEHGLEVDAVVDGLGALDRLAAAQADGQPYDRVVTAIRLPDIDGLKLLAILRSRHPTLPVVVVSRYGREGTADAVERLRRARFLPKPVSAAQIVAAFDELAAAPDETGDAGGPGWNPPEAYVFVQLAEDADPERVFTTLYGTKDVQRVDAVRGSADVVIRMDGLDRAGVDAFVRENVASVPGVAAARVRHVAAPDLDESVRRYLDSYERRLPADLLAPGRATLYAVVEIAPPAMKTLYPQLYFIDEVVEVAADARGDAVVLLLQGADFPEIRAVLNEKVRYTDGVLRVDELVVVNMFEIGEDAASPVE